MRTIAAVVLATFGFTGAAVAAPKGKGKAPAAAKKEAAAPTANAEEMAKLKGAFKWGMTPDQVMAEVGKRVEASYADRLKETANDPTRQDRLRKALRAELDGVKGKYIKFDGQKTGYDGSIVDQEFAHKTGESMLVAKEDSATRYFFFADERLYKMFVAFDKEMLKDKSFDEFGQLMQARFGKAREVVVEEKMKAGVRRKLDHYEWGSKSGDALKLVDRSEFYDVYCLVLFDAGTANRLAEARKVANPGGEKKDALVEAVVNTKASDQDPNDNVVDRILGKETKRPGERAADITVPSPATSNVKAPTPAEVNRKEAASSSGSSSPAPEQKKPASKGGLEF